MAATRRHGEQDLRHWLANEDWYPSHFTRDFLASTPESEANDTLAEIADDAGLEKLTFWSLFTIGFALAGFSPSFGLAGPSTDDRKAGIRAALYLAERNDARCLPPLARVWSKPGLLQSRYQATIAQSLTGLLLNSSRDVTAPYAEALGELAHRVWRARSARHDLSDADTALLFALLPHLSADTARALWGTQAIVIGANRNRLQATFAASSWTRPKDID